MHHRLCSAACEVLPMKSSMQCTVLVSFIVSFSFAVLTQDAFRHRPPSAASKGGSSKLGLFPLRAAAFFYLFGFDSKASPPVGTPSLRRGPEALSPRLITFANAF